MILREEPNAVLVPNEAIHVEGGNHFVFVRDRRFRHDGFPRVFHTRSIRVGAKDERNTEIIAGVLPGEFVATKNSSVLMAELLRGKIGEGCCAHGHPHSDGRTVLRPTQRHHSCSLASSTSRCTTGSRLSP